MTDDFLHVFRESPTGILLFEVVDQSQKPERWVCQKANPSACEMLNISRPGGLTFDAMLPGDMVTSLSNHSTSTNAEIFLPLSNQWLMVNGNRNGNKMVVTLSNITFLNRKQKELELQYKRIDQSNHDLQNFAYVASHDLHAPLRKIQSFGKLLSDRYIEVLAGNGKLYLERILESAQRMERLLDDLVTFSSATKDKEGLIPTDLGQILNEVLADGNLLENPNITLEIPHNLPVIRAIPSQMRQLFQNLLDNACKFTRPNIPCVIRVRYQQVLAAQFPEFDLSPETAYFILEVEDNGIGFDQENADRIFNIFQRLHGLSEYKGSGIGLAICKKVVDNHRGYIKAKGEKEVGATFTVVLPFE